MACSANRSTAPVDPYESDYPKNALPPFSPSSDLAADMRKIIVSKMIAFGALKGKFDKHYRAAEMVADINGEQVYIPWYHMDHQIYFIFSEDKTSKIWNVVEAWRLLGWQDEDFWELYTTWVEPSVAHITQHWKYKHNKNVERFEAAVQVLDETLKDISTIEVEVEFERYRTSVYPDETQREYHTRWSIYGDNRSVGREFTNAEGWSVKDEAVQRKSSAAAIGFNAIFRDNEGNNVTANYPASLIGAVQSMLIYSGSQFMNQLSSEKIREVTHQVNMTIQDIATGEPIATYVEYTGVVGLEVFDCRVLPGFVEASPSTDYLIELADGTYSGNGATDDYPSFFWTWSDTTADTDDAATNQLPVRPGDEDVFMDTAFGPVIRRRGFMQMTYDNFGYYMGSYFQIKVDVKEASGIKKFIGNIMKVFGGFIDLVLDVFSKIPFLCQALTILTNMINMVLGTDFTPGELLLVIFKLVAKKVATAFGGPIAGEAVGMIISMASAHTSVAEERREFEKEEQEALDQEEFNAKKMAAEQERREQNYRNEEGRSNASNVFFAFLASPIWEAEQNMDPTAEIDQSTNVDDTELWKMD